MDGRPGPIAEQESAAIGIHGVPEDRPTIGPVFVAQLYSCQKGLSVFSRVKCMYPTLAPWRQPTPKRTGASVTSPLRT